MADWKSPMLLRTFLLNKIPNTAERILVKALVDALAIRIAEGNKKDPLAMYRGHFTGLPHKYAQVINKNFWDLVL